MSLLNSCKLEPPSSLDIPSSQVNDEDNCLICRLMRIRHERSDMIKWLLSSDKSTTEKVTIATLLTGIKFDEEVLDCLNDPSVREFLLNE
ncbi:MAG: hypothetical protein ACTSQB_01810 [Candidatus Heimdallarchaeota archaeon]